MYEVDATTDARVKRLMALEKQLGIAKPGGHSPVVLLDKRLSTERKRFLRSRSRRSCRSMTNERMIKGAPMNRWMAMIGDVAILVCLAASGRATVDHRSYALMVEQGQHEQAEDVINGYPARRMKMADGDVVTLLAYKSRIHRLLERPARSMTAPKEAATQPPQWQLEMGAALLAIAQVDEAAPLGLYRGEVRLTLARPPPLDRLSRHILLVHQPTQAANGKK